MRVLASIQRAWIAIVARRYKPTHVYVSHPKLFVLLPAGVRRSSTIVYDCMDDAVAMAPPSARPTILAYERALADAATSILVSSGALLARLETRHGPDVTDKVTLVQNGVELRSSRLAPTHYARGTREPIVGYAGTVARWFDFDALLEAMDVCPEIRVRIVGPRTGDEPRHDRIEYRRPVSHEELPTHLADCQALIMPFKRDEIVTAVNPVKLYEYLLYGVPVISARYGEIEDQFGEFVETYDTAAELTELFRKLADGELTARGDAAAVEEFVEASTWAVRWQAVARATERAAVRS
jgi:glycosyltransferase involved in cell wall biosynthesis